MGQWTQQMVSIKEMTDVMRVMKEQVGLKRNQWVRLKRGLFKDDLAQVDYVDLSSNSIHLRMLPRYPRGQDFEIFTLLFTKSLIPDVRRYWSTHYYICSVF